MPSPSFHNSHTRKAGAGQNFPILLILTAGILPQILLHPGIGLLDRRRSPYRGLLGIDRGVADVFVQAFPETCGGMLDRLTTA